MTEGVQVLPPGGQTVEMVQRTFLDRMLRDAIAAAEGVVANATPPGELREAQVAAVRRAGQGWCDLWVKALFGAQGIFAELRQPAMLVMPKLSADQLAELTAAFRDFRPGPIMAVDDDEYLRLLRTVHRMVADLHAVAGLSVRALPAPEEPSPAEPALPAVPVYAEWPAKPEGPVTWEMCIPMADWIAAHPARPVGVKLRRPNGCTKSVLTFARERGHDALVVKFKVSPLAKESILFHPWLLGAWERWPHAQTVLNDHWKSGAAGGGHGSAAAEADAIAATGA